SHNHFDEEPRPRNPPKPLAHQQIFELLTRPATMDPSIQTNTEATDNRAMSPNMDGHIVATDNESVTTHRIPVYWNETKYEESDRETSAMETEMAALKERITFLEESREAEKEMYESQIGSLNFDLFTARRTIDTMEHVYVAPLRAAVQRLEEDNRKLRWQHNNLLATARRQNNTTNQENESSSAVDVKAFRMGVLFGLLIGLPVAGIAWVVASSDH
ncbi:hypothetical protein QBC39DRAFT_404580, partial [Podospora conica]